MSSDAKYLKCICFRSYHITESTVFQLESIYCLSSSQMLLGTFSRQTFLKTFRCTFPFQNNTCRFNASLVKAGIGGWVSMGDTPSEETLQQMAVFYGPLSVRIDGNHASFQHYKGGE